MTSITVPINIQNNNFVIPPCFDNSIQTQHNSDSDASVGANYATSTGLDQSINYHGNRDGKDNDDSQPYDTPGK